MRWAEQWIENYWRERSRKTGEGGAETAVDLYKKEPHDWEEEFTLRIGDGEEHR